MWANERETRDQEQPFIFLYYFRVRRLVCLSPVCPIRQRVEAVRQSSPHYNPVELRAGVVGFPGLVHSMLYLPPRAESPVSKAPDVRIATRHATEETGAKEVRVTAKSASLPNKECTVDVTGQLVECRYQGCARKAAEPKFIVLVNTLLKLQYYRGH